MDDTAQVAPGETTTIDVLGNDINASTGALIVTEINGIAVSPGDSVTLTTGQVITLNPDGTLSATGDADEEIINFTYTMENAAGDSDTGFITLSQVPCFVAGTVIDTALGPRLVEQLQPGDRIRTADNGYQPLRWIGRRTVRAVGAHAPIEIAVNNLLDGRVDLIFGEGAVLVSAKDLVNDDTVRPVEGGSVTYVHLLFDAHEIVYSNGLASESFLPGPMSTSIFEAEVLAEICSLFPALDPRTGAGYGPAARRILKAHEARSLKGRAA